MKEVYLGLIIFLLFRIMVSDVRRRVVRHSDLLCLAVLLLLHWFWYPNYEVILYSLVILAVGVVLHFFNILGSGDTKLLVVLSLGVTPTFLAIMLYGSAILGGFLAIAYLFYGLCTDLDLVRKRGIPYALPISISGGAAVFISNLSNWNGS